MTHLPRLVKAWMKKSALDFAGDLAQNLADLADMHERQGRDITPEEGQELAELALSFALPLVSEELRRMMDEDIAYAYLQEADDDEYVEEDEDIEVHY